VRQAEGPVAVAVIIGVVILIAAATSRTPQGIDHLGRAEREHAGYQSAAKRQLSARGLHRVHRRRIDQHGTIRVIGTFSELLNTPNGRSAFIDFRQDSSATIQAGDGGTMIDSML
jgi:hypothetical protein